MTKQLRSSGRAKRHVARSAEYDKGHGNGKDKDFRQQQGGNGMMGMPNTEQMMKGMMSMMQSGGMQQMQQPPVPDGQYGGQPAYGGAQPIQ